MTLTDEQKEYILELGPLSNRNYNLAMTLFNEKFGFEVSINSFIKIWAEANLTSHFRGGKRRGLDKQEFLDLYENCSGNLEDMATATGYQFKSILNKCKKYGLNYGDYNYKNLGKNRKNSHSLDEKYDRVFSFSFPSRR